MTKYGKIIDSGRRPILVSHSNRIHNTNSPTFSEFSLKFRRDDRERMEEIVRKYPAEDVPVQRFKSRRTEQNRQKRRGHGLPLPLSIR